MTNAKGNCCGNCAAFMRDPFNDDQGACAVIDDDCIATGTYNWTHESGDCKAWESKSSYVKKRNKKVEREKYEKRMRGDWS